MDQARYNALLAQALAGQGRYDEAQAVLAPALEFLREEAARGGAGLDYARDHAYALYVDALAQGPGPDKRARRDASLAEASRLLGTLSPEARQLTLARKLSEQIAAARGSPAG